MNIYPIDCAARALPVLEGVERLSWHELRERAEQLALHHGREARRSTSPPACPCRRCATRSAACGRTSGRTLIICPALMYVGPSFSMMTRASLASERSSVSYTHLTLPTKA